MSLAPLVLIIITAPAALALERPPVPDLGPQVGDATQAASDTADSANEAAESARVQAEDEALGAYDFATGTVSIAWDYAESTVHGAYVRVTDLLREAQEGFSSTKPAGYDGSASSQSTQTIVRPESFQASLLFLAASTGATVLLIWAGRKLLALAGMPLLSRIAHSDIYENDARRTVGDLVVNEPGLCLNDIVGRTGFSRNAVSYHLFVLEKEEEIISVKDGKYRRYFTRNGKYVNGAKNVVAALRNETTLKLAQVVATRPGAIQRELCIELGATPSATCWHAKRLLELGVIRKEKVSNTVKYFPGEALAKYDLGDFGLPKFTPTPSPAPALA